jgi:acrylyl-CoA reductase (NADPH)
MCPIERRKEAWIRLEKDLDGPKLAAMTREIGLGEVAEAASAILKGEVRGRIVVKIG